MATDVSTSLPQVTLAPKTTITVATGDAGAIITRLNVYAYNPATGQVENIPVIGPFFVYEARALGG